MFGAELQVFHPLRGVAVHDDKGVVGAHHHLAHAIGVNQVVDARLVVDQVVDKHLPRHSAGGMFQGVLDRWHASPSVFQARHQHRQRTTAVAEGDAQVGQGGQPARGDHGRGGQTNFTREGQGLLQGGRADQAVHARWAQGVHKNRCPHTLRGLKKWCEVGVANGFSVDVAADLHASHTQLTHHALELLDGHVHVLQRHGTQADEAIGLPAHLCGQGVVEVANQGPAVIGLQPVRQQLGHGRDHLAGDAGLGHVARALVKVKAAGGDGAVDLVLDHHMALAAGFGRRDGRPGHAFAPTHIRRKRGRHPVGVGVDQAAVANGFKNGHQSDKPRWRSH